MTAHDNNKSEMRVHDHEILATEHEASMARDVANRLYSLGLLCDYLDWPEVAEHIAAARAELAKIIVQDCAGGGQWQRH